MSVEFGHSKREQSVRDEDATRSPKKWPERQFERREHAMSDDRTQFAVGHRKVATMPRVMKRSLHVAMAAALTAGVVLFVMMVNGFLVGRGGSLGGVDVWLAFIKRSDIIGTIILTALVTTAFLYWQRDKDKEQRR
jgi:hypothetical protein